jgi:4-hydroxybenzoate polyprenyltransferase
MPLYLPEAVSWWKKVLAYCVLALVLCVLLSATIRHPWILAVLIVLAISIIYESKKHKQRLRKIADERENEGICTFARSFE